MGSGGGGNSSPSNDSILLEKGNGEGGGIPSASPKGLIERNPSLLAGVGIHSLKQLKTIEEI